MNMRPPSDKEEQQPSALSVESRRVDLTTRSTRSSGRFSITPKKVKSTLPTYTAYYDMHAIPLP